MLYIKDDIAYELHGTRCYFRCAYYTTLVMQKTSNVPRIDMQKDTPWYMYYIDDIGTTLMRYNNRMLRKLLNSFLYGRPMRITEILHKYRKFVVRYTEYYGCEDEGEDEV